MNSTAQIDHLIEQEIALVLYLRANLQTLEPAYRSQILSAIIGLGEQWIELERLAYPRPS